MWGAAVFSHLALINSNWPVSDHALVDLDSLLHMESFRVGVYVLVVYPAVPVRGHLR